MPSYAHTEIIRRLAKLDSSPSLDADRNSWLRAKGHVEFLADNANEDEIILCAIPRRGLTSCAETYIHAEIVDEAQVTPLDHSGLEPWSSNPTASRASYSWASTDDSVRLECYGSMRPGMALHPRQLVFCRRLEGLDEHYYFELLQEFTHAADIHWRDEEKAYCRLDENGDLEPVVSITNTRDSDSLVLVTCKRKPLEQYLKATRTSLIRFFEVRVIDLDTFRSWDDADEKRSGVSEDLFLHQLIHPDGHSWNRGVQVIRVNKPWDEPFSSPMGSKPDGENRNHASFIIQDWRNRKIVEVSAASEATTNFFVANQNSLPFELSPAFFRPEVLSKYKTDRDKYTINEEQHFIECRGTWFLKTYDVNEAGQVHTYLCYLRDLPYQEQLHWKSYNEKPKAPISKRAWENDFQGRPSEEIKPLERVLWVLRHWTEAEVVWWRIRNQSPSRRVNTPLTASRDEWALAFEDLAKIVIEGFQPKVIQGMLKEKAIPFDDSDRSLTLLEKLLTGLNGGSGEAVRLSNLRQVQRIRTVAQAHAGGSEGDKLAREARLEFGSYKKHFEDVCQGIAEELELIEEYLEE